MGSVGQVKFVDLRMVFSLLQKVSHLVAGVVQSINLSVSVTFKGQY